MELLKYLHIGLPDIESNKVTFWLEVSMYVILQHNIGLIASYSLRFGHEQDEKLLHKNWFKFDQVAKGIGVLDMHVISHCGILIFRRTL